METCPRCGEPKLDPEKVRNALSRRDNTTLICSDCGDDEAWYDYVLAKLSERRSDGYIMAIRDQEVKWITEGKPFNEILGKPYVPLMARG